MGGRDNVEEANDRERTKYQEFMEKCIRKSWKTSYTPIEVGYRGFLPQESEPLTGFGLIGNKKNKATQNVSETAEKTPKCLWIRTRKIWIRIQDLNLQ